ncbi:hypothetical protein [Roseibacillus persicicus]|uniref:hypothetical protein n=1 Tax=Roseibacillus persicicus TaxID=454148 RepID=UPI00280FAD3A|nr:hypothetical protein [Roseibacillus persicicus]MDQ8188859.1 hypothetical protein [Roseibacillus persicicus]
MAQTSEKISNNLIHEAKKARSAPDRVLIVGRQWLKKELVPEAPFLKKSKILSSFRVFVSCLASKESSLILEAHGPPRNTFYGRVLEPVYLFFLNWLLVLSRCELIVIDGEDSRLIHHRDRRILALCDVYFKRELASDFWGSVENLWGPMSTGHYRRQKKYRDLVGKLRPISLGLLSVSEKDFSANPDLEKDIDLFAAMTVKMNPIRKEMLDWAKELKAEGLRVFISDERVEFEEYKKLLLRSRYVLSPSGYGWDCYRHYEAALSGAIPIADPAFILQRTNAPFIFLCITVDGLRSIITQTAEEEERIMKANFEVVRKFHTQENFLEVLLGIADSSGSCLSGLPIDFTKSEYAQ